MRVELLDRLVLLPCAERALDSTECRRQLRCGLPDQREKAGNSPHDDEAVPEATAFEQQAGSGESRLLGVLSGRLTVARCDRGVRRPIWGDVTIWPRSPPIGAVIATQTGNLISSAIVPLLPEQLGDFLGALLGQ
jgi:hypothetical protein